MSKPCCKCTSPARAELNGRLYCFTHLPLMTDWRPLKRKKKKKQEASS